MAELEEFKNSDAYMTFWNALVALVEDPPAVCHIHHIGHSMLQGFFRRIYPGSPLKRYEVLTVYFPVDTTAELRNRIETEVRLDSIQLRYGMMASCQPRVEDEKEEQLQDRQKGWVEETLEWKGQPVRAFLFLFEWLSEEGERIWKQEERDVIRHADDKELPLGIDSFFQDLKELGMLGFESGHGNFVKIRAPR